MSKKFFIQLCILISGKASRTNENIDVFIKPLLEELLKLWTRVVVQDFSKPEGKWHFVIRGILMWVISNYLEYGLISGLCTHGHRRCTMCGLATESRTALLGNNVNAKIKLKKERLFI